MSKRKDVMTVEDIEIIGKLIDANMSGAEISRITGRSESGTQKYAQIIRQIKDCGKINIHPGSFNFDAVKEYCKKHGYPEPTNVHPAATGEQNKSEIGTVADAQIGNEMFHRLANDINFLAISLHDLAEFIMENLAKGGADK